MGQTVCRMAGAWRKQIQRYKKEIEEKMGLYIIYKSEIKKLKEKCNPKHFMKPYNSAKIAKANELYAKLDIERLSYSDYVYFKKQISELYDKDDE